MGYNEKKQTEFPKYLLESWESSDGINFAIALARLTGWLLHVDWYKKDGEAEDEQTMTPIRVYVADNSDYVFDFTGRRKLNAFYTYLIEPLTKRRVKPGKGAIVSRFYSEELLLKLPLRVRPDDNKIVEAVKAIQLNTSFLGKVPKRPIPLIPAYDAANFTFGLCSVYAQAMEDIFKLPAVAIVATKYTEQFSLTKSGYSHSFNLHPDGSVEDVWGRQTVDDVIKRLGILEYTLDEAMHKTVVGNLTRNSPEKFAEAYKQATILITEFYIHQAQ